MTEPSAPVIPTDEPVESTSRRRLPRWTAWAAAGLVVLVAGVTAAWSSFWSARLTWPADDPGAFGISVPSTDASRSWTFADLVVCLEGVDTAVVDFIEVDRGNARVTDFAVRPHDPVPGDEGVVMLFGDRPGNLADTDFGSRDRTVRGRCADEAYTELALELTRPTAQTARADGLLIHWSAGIRSGTLHVAGHFVLCADPDPSSEGCPTIP